MEATLPVLYTLPYNISFEDQHTLTQYIYNNAEWLNASSDVSSQGQGYDNCFGRIQVRRPTEASLREHNFDASLPLHELVWKYRLVKGLEWEWIDTPITQIVKNLIDRIGHLYSSVTRIIVLGQRVGVPIPLHTDKVPNTLYTNSVYCNYPDIPVSVDHTTNNHHIALKWALTEIEGNNGLPTIQINNNTFHYDVGTNLFAINEVDVLHGADAVAHKRGVIFIDGFLNWEALEKETKLPVILRS